ncbi:MAG TPA: 50S ribosomal protein L10 [Thermoanaerobaculia bacterium]|nr:50S ribosomal protein L10 [Thermoanaerobaculia bacterium]
MKREDKQQIVETLKREIGQATNAFLIEFKGITVPQVTELRRHVRDTGSRYVVVKNTLALIALKDSPMIELREQFRGETAVAYNSGDAVALAKALTRFAKDVPALTFKGVLLDGKVVPAEQIEDIASLPSREELVSKLLYVLQSPIRGLATVLQANIRNLAVVLDQVARQKGGGEEPEQAASE